MATVVSAGFKMGEALALRSVLDDLQKRVDGSIQQAINVGENAGIRLELEAGRQVTLAIQNAKNAYLESLDQTVDRLDAVARSSLNSLASMVQEMENKGSLEISRIEAAAQQLINTLPFANTHPQLKSVQPKYVVLPSSGRELTLQFWGNFKDAAHQQYEPSLEVGGRVYHPISTTTQNLAFRCFIDKTSTSQFSCLSGLLKIPFEAGKFFTEKSVAEYKILLQVLPSSPGKIKVYYTSKQSEKIMQNKTVTINARADNDFPARSVTKTAVIHPDSGWSIDPSSVQGPFVHKGAHGSHGQPQIVSKDSNQIVAQVGLSAVDGKHMGRIAYDVRFFQVQQVQKIEKRQEELVILWQNSKVLDHENNEEVHKIEFDAFDGTHSEYAGPDLNNPYLKIRYANGKYQLSAEMPQDF